MSLMKRDSQTALTPPITRPNITRPSLRKQDREKPTVTVTISPEWIAWIDHQVSTGVFRSRSHGIELCIKTVAMSQAKVSADPSKKV